MSSNIPKLSLLRDNPYNGQTVMQDKVPNPYGRKGSPGPLVAKFFPYSYFKFWYVSSSVIPILCAPSFKRVIKKTK